MCRGDAPGQWLPVSGAVMPGSPDDFSDDSSLDNSFKRKPGGEDNDFGFAESYESGHRGQEVSPLVKDAADRTRRSKSLE